MGAVYEARVAVLVGQVALLDPNEKMTEDDYFGACYDLVRKAFPDTVEDAQLLLADTPEAWGWSDNGGGVRCVGLGGTVAGFVVDAFQSAADQRLP